MPTSSASRTIPSTQARQYYLDWLRILAFALLVPYHVGMYYVTWYWHIKSPQLLPDLEPWMRMFSPWRMDLLFVVSGAATAYMLAKRSADGAWLRERAHRLLWPLLFGALVIVPPQSYFEVIQHHGYHGTYLDFLALYLTGYSGFCTAPGKCLIMPTWNHLWYLAYLFTYTAVLWLISRYQSSWLVHQRLPRDFKMGPTLLLLLPLLILISNRLMLRSHFPDTRALVDDWFAHSQYFFMFLFGAMLARRSYLADHAETLRWCSLILATCAWAALVWSPIDTMVDSNTGANGIVKAILVSIQKWCAILAALGFAHRWLNIDARARAYLNDAIFPVYILHQTIIILLASAALPLATRPGLQAIMLTILTFALGLIGQELLRHTNGLRPLFGLKPR